MSVASSAASATWLRAGAYALVALVAIVLPLVLSEIRPPFLSMSYGLSFLPYELLGLTGGVAILAAGVFELRRRGGADVATRIAVVVPCLLALHFTTLTSEYAQRRFDYDCYEYAGRALLAGESPYRSGLIYLYPPLTAQLFAAAHEGVARVGESLGVGSERDAVWDRVFYLYQCAQVLLLLGAYFLLLRLGRDLGLVSRWAPVLIGGLLLFDNAVFRTLRHGQVNLWVLDLSLVGIVWARQRPAIAGVAIALAGHVKLYPLLLMFPLLFCGRVPAALWTLVATAGVVALGSDWGRDWALWSQYATLVSSGFPGEVAFRNNSLHSMAYNTARLVFDGNGNGPVVRWAVRLGTLAFAAWALVRFALRERIRRRARTPDADSRCFAAHGADALTFALLASPSVWEHHYVMALPLALVACVARGVARPGLVAIGLFLMLGMPTFDLFPFGYHRFAGMLVLWVASSPRGETGWLAPTPQAGGSRDSAAAPLPPSLEVPDSARLAR